MFKEKRGDSMKEVELINIENKLIDFIGEYDKKIKEIADADIDAELLYISSLINLACMEILQTPKINHDNTIKELEKYKNYLLKTKIKFLKVKRLDEVM